MIDPYNITNYNRTEGELQKFLLFCIVVAGKTAYIQAQKLEEFLLSVNERLMLPEHVDPFQSLISADQHGIFITQKDYNLNRMTPKILEEIPGVGMKTSRFFLLHSDIFYKDKIAILDTHILKFIKENIDDRAPKSTPVIPLTYRFWEDMFLNWCNNNNKNVADFDLEVWKSYARKKNEQTI